ncbi:MAG: hypothetical protein ACJ8CF_07275, partial [Microvirga sp.]
RRAYISSGPLGLGYWPGEKELRASFHEALTKFQFIEIALQTGYLRELDAEPNAVRLVKNRLQDNEFVGDVLISASEFVQLMSDVSDIAVPRRALVWASLRLLACSVSWL